MAQLALLGTAAVVYLDNKTDRDGEPYVRARCMNVGCDWTEAYDGMNDATEYAQDHADLGGPRWSNCRRAGRPATPNLPS